MANEILRMGISSVHTVLAYHLLTMKEGLGLILFTL